MLVHANQTEKKHINKHTHSNQPSRPAVEHIKKQLGLSDLSVFRRLASAATCRVQLLPSGLCGAGGEKETLLQREKTQRRRGNFAAAEVVDRMNWGGVLSV